MTRRRWRRHVRVTRWALAGIGVLLMAGVVAWLVWKVPSALYSYLPDAKDRAGAEASTRTGIIAGLAGLAALGSLAVTARTYQLSLQGQLTDRYTKAIGQLGDAKLEIRLGGIFALERLAVDSKRDHPTVVEVLGAFVRERTDPNRSEKPTVADVLSAALKASQLEDNETADDENFPAKPTKDVQAALDVLGRLPVRPDVSRGDLAGANLARADLSNANLTEARLSNANLTWAKFFNANLTGASLMGANLTGAFLMRTNLTGASLLDATLTNTWIRHVDLTRVEGLTQDQLDVADGDQASQLPVGRNRPARWRDTTDSEARIP